MLFSIQIKNICMNTLRDTRTSWLSISWNSELGDIRASLVDSEGGGVLCSGLNTGLWAWLEFAGWHNCCENHCLLLLVCASAGWWNFFSLSEWVNFSFGGENYERIYFTTTPGWLYSHWLLVAVTICWSETCTQAASSKASLKLPTQSFL